MISNPVPLVTDTVDMDSVQVCVRNPIMHITWDEGQYTSYAIYVETNNVAFTYPKTLVRRRYSEFVRLRKMLKEQHPTIAPPTLPAKSFFADKFCSKFIGQRIKGLESFLETVLQNHLYLSNRSLHLFVQSNLPMEEIEMIVYERARKQIKSEPHLILCPFPAFDFIKDDYNRDDIVSTLEDVIEQAQRSSVLEQCDNTDSHSHVTLGAKISICSPALEVPNHSDTAVLPDINEDEITNVGSMDSDYSCTPGNSSPPSGKSPMSHGILHHRTSSQNSSASASPVRKKKVSFNSEVTVAHLFTE